MQKKNLVLGAIKGYQQQQLETFVSSLANTNFDGDLCFLTTGISLETKTYLSANNVKCFDIAYRGKGSLNSWSRFWPVLKPIVNTLPERLSRLVLKSILPLQTVRFLHYKDFLKQNAARYDKVLLTDVRDVFFQDNPFKGVFGNKVQCYEEFAVIGTELQYNVAWIKSLYGDTAADSFSSEKILCSGTIIGSVDEMIAFLEEFETVLKKANNLSIGGSDQGIYNYLVRTMLKTKVDIKQYGEGQVITISSSDEKSYSFKNCLLVNTNDEIIPVVHQYDRLEITEKNIKQYLSSISKPHYNDLAELEMS